MILMKTMMKVTQLKTNFHEYSSHFINIFVSYISVLYLIKLKRQKYQSDIKRF